MNIRLFLRYYAIFMAIVFSHPKFNLPPLVLVFPGLVLGFAFVGDE